MRRFAPHLAAPTLVWLALCLRAAHAPQLFDEGELAAAICGAGASHPPGQILHALLGQWPLALPLASVPFRLALLSGLGCLAVYGLGLRLGTTLFSLQSRPTGRVTAIACGCAALLQLPLLRQSLRIEVYSLALALLLAAFDYALRAARDQDHAAWTRGTLLTALLGLLHPSFALAAAGAGGLSAVTQLYRSRARLRCALQLLRRSLAACVLLALGVAYLPLRYAVHAPMWGEAGSLSALLRYLSAAAYRQNLNDESLSFVHGLGGVLELAGRQTPLIASCFAIALLLGWRRRRFLGASTLLVVLATLPAATLRELPISNPDAVAYAAPLIAVLQIAATCGIAALCPPRWQGLSAALVASACAITTLADRGWLNPTHPARALEQAAWRSALPPHGVALIASDAVISTWAFERSCLEARPDAQTFAAGLASSSWQWRASAAHPGLDGQPAQAGPPAPTKLRYLRGFAAQARRVAPLLSESGIGLEHTAQGRCGPAWLEGSGDCALAEQLYASAAEALRSAAAGDQGNLAHALGQGAWSLAHAHLARGDATGAYTLLQHFVPTLPPCPDCQARRPWVPVVRTPEIFGRNTLDLQRFGASWLWASGKSREAIYLLAQQSSAPEALLQLALFQADAGDLVAARQTLTRYTARRPSTPDPLASWLAQQLALGADTSGGL